MVKVDVRLHEDYARARATRSDANRGEVEVSSAAIAKRRARCDHTESFAALCARFAIGETTTTKQSRSRATSSQSFVRALSAIGAKLLAPSRSASFARSLPHNEWNDTQSSANFALHCLPPLQAKKLSFGHLASDE